VFGVGCACAPIAGWCASAPYCAALIAIMTAVAKTAYLAEQKSN